MEETAKYYLCSVSVSNMIHKELLTTAIVACQVLSRGEFSNEINGLMSYWLPLYLLPMRQIECFKLSIFVTPTLLP